METNPPALALAVVAEDEPILRIEAIEILEDAGFAVYDTPDADGALRFLEHRHADVGLLFSDVEMPGRMDGFELARTASARWPHIAIVVCSGVLRPGPGALPHGAHFIDKPFSPDLIRNAIRSMMRP